MSIVVLGRAIRPHRPISEDPEPALWRRASHVLSRWVWGALCCGVPGVPCYFCICRERLEVDSQPADVNVVLGDEPSVSFQLTELEARPHRPNAPGGRKSSPEMLVAVRCALSELQGHEAAEANVVNLEPSKLSEPG